MVPATPTSPAKNVPVPELPDAAKAKTPEGAVAFTEFYVELMNYTWATNDIKPILKHTEPSCSACFKGTINHSEYRLKHDIHVVGGDMAAGKLAGDVEDEIGTVFGELAQPAFKSYLMDGELIEESPDVPAQLVTFTLVFESSFWTVRAIEAASLDQ